MQSTSCVSRRSLRDALCASRGRGCATRFLHPGPVFGLRWGPPDSRNWSRGCGMRFVHPGRGRGTRGTLRMLFSHTLWSPAADQRLLRLRMFASGRNFRPQASRSGFGSPVVPQCRRPGMPDAAAASRDPGPITGNSTGVQGPDLQPPEPPSPLECTVTKNAPASPLESTLPQSLDLKSPGMNTYKKSGWGPPSLPPCFLASLPQPGFSYSQLRGSPCPENSS